MRSLAIYDSFLAVYLFKCIPYEYNITEVFLGTFNAGLLVVQHLELLLLLLLRLDILPAFVSSTTPVIRPGAASVTWASISGSDIVTSLDGWSVGNLGVTHPVPKALLTTAAAPGYKWRATARGGVWKTTFPQVQEGECPLFTLQ